MIDSPAKSRCHNSLESLGTNFQGPDSETLVIGRCIILGPSNHGLHPGKAALFSILAMRSWDPASLIKNRRRLQSLQYLIRDKLSAYHKFQNVQFSL